MDRTVGSILRAHMAIFNPAQASEAAQKLREAGLAAAEQAKRAAAAAGEMVSSHDIRRVSVTLDALQLQLCARDSWLHGPKNAHIYCIMAPTAALSPQVQNEAIAASNATADGIRSARDRGASMLHAAQDLPGRAMAKGEALAHAVQEIPEKVGLGPGSAPRFIASRSHSSRLKSLCKGIRQSRHLKVSLCFSMIPEQGIP